MPRLHLFLSVDQKLRLMLYDWMPVHPTVAPVAWAVNLLAGTYCLYRLLLNACYREGRKERRWEPNLRLMPLNEPAADDDVSTIVLRDELERGFRRLSIDHRVVVVLYHFLDLPLDRVAEILGIPVGTAHSRLHHAMRGLRAALDADARPPVREAAQ